MTLTEEQAALFYKLWIPLLDFVNRRYKIDKELYGMTSPKGLPIMRVMEITDKLWKHLTVIDKYIAENSEKLSEEEIAIVTGWKKVVQGTFVVDRHLKAGSVLIFCETNEVYIAKGIYSGWREMLADRPLPQLIKAALIPFQGVIISDGLIELYGAHLGKNMADDARSIYLYAKADNRLIKSLD